jgi:acyl carrier protein
MTTTPLTESGLLAVVRTAIASVAPDADLAHLDLDADIAEAVDLDSMDVLNVMEAVAQQTGLEVPERDYPRTRTLRGFVDELAELAASR